MGRRRFSYSSVRTVSPIGSSVDKFKTTKVVLNHSISKGIKYNQATATFHQWRDQSNVYGLNFPSKLDAQEFGATMMKILDSVNGSTANYTSQMIVNGGATLPPSSSNMTNNNNNNNNNINGNQPPPAYKRQSSQPPSSIPNYSNG